MLLPALVFAVSLQTGVVVPVQDDLSPACFVFGEVYWWTHQISSQLFSNCPIKIQRKGDHIVMESNEGSRIVDFKIPKDPGVHEFVYRWGQDMARFGGEKMAVSLGTGEDTYVKN